MKACGTMFLSAILALVAPAVAQEAVVKIYSEGSARGDGQGSGFFTSKQGQIVTAYHVVEGASRITVMHDRLGTFADLQVEFIAPQYDLAVLQLSNNQLETPFAQLDLEPNLTEPLELIGFPRGGMLQQFRGLATRPGFVSSHTIRDADGRRLFEGDIQIVPLDLSIYSGMSGGPVVGPRGVVGVLSGSYDEGGGIGWAIPSQYLQMLTTIQQRPEQLRWPRLTLMASAWRNLRATVRLNARGGQIFEEYVDAAETVARLNDEIYQQAMFLRRDFLTHRPFLLRVVADPTLSNDWDTANRFLQGTGSQAFGSYARFQELGTEYDQTIPRLHGAIGSLMLWMADESGVEGRRGQALAREARELRQEMAGLQGGLAAHLEIRTEDVLAELPGLAQSLERTSSHAGQNAKAQLKLIDFLLPLLEKYSSPKALLFLKSQNSLLRRLARLAEPFVYEVR